MILERGTLLNNRYRIVEILGQGGMGSVYKAVDENLGMDVAVKDNLFTTEEYARQFRREAIILANLRHPNLPRVTDHFVIPGQGQYLVMDYIEGEDLRQRMERVGVLPEDEVIMIGAAMCDALSYLGSRKPAIIHRDIKPGNVKITPQGQIFLVDFGLAKTMQGSQATTTGARAMTPGFSPPEQYGTARTDQRSDVFSLGATLYAALTGATPEDALARAMDQAELTPIRKHNSKVSRRIASVIERALEVRPDARYQGADEFKQALLNTSASVRRREGDYYVSPPPEDSKVAAAENALLPLESREKLLLPEDRSPSLLPISTPIDDEPAPRSKKRKKSSGLGCWIVLVLLVAMLAAGFYWITRVDPGLPRRAYTLYSPTLAAWLPLDSAALPGTAGGSQTPIAAAPATETPTVTPTQPATQTPVFTATPTLTVAPTETPTPQATAMGGGLGQIAYASKVGGVAQVYLMNSDGSDPRPVTKLPEGACQPSWSPDGARLVFVSPCDGNTDYYPGSAMYIINADGSGLLPLPTMSGGDYDPQWSPDGKHIAFTSLRNSGRPQLFVLNLEDNEVTSLSEKYGTDFQPAWSPDGLRLVFLSNRRGGQQIWALDETGQDPQQFTHDNSVLNTRPSFSPDGKSLIFTQSLPTGGVPRVIIAPFNFENYSEFRVNSMPMRDAVFSPDGFWVVFEGWEVGGSHDIYTMSASGAALTQLTNDAALDFDPAWRPGQ
jgi:serine/threonine protein kinase